MRRWRRRYRCPRSSDGAADHEEADGGQGGEQHGEDRAEQHQRPGADGQTGGQQPGAEQHGQRGFGNTLAEGHGRTVAARDPRVELAEERR
jgi:hypothetical protein